jgi:hypothetical protein
LNLYKEILVELRSSYLKLINYLHNYGKAKTFSTR